MSRRDEQDGLPAQERAVIKRLHQEVWKMASEEDGVTFFAALRRGLAVLGLGRYPALVYWVTDNGSELEIRFWDVARDGWHQVAREKSGPVADLWRQGVTERTSRRPDPALSNAMEAASCHTGVPVRSLLEVPFSHGVLGLYAEEPGAFEAGLTLCADSVGAVLSVYFHRLADLKALEAKERQLRYIQRLQLMGQLTAEVAHDLSNPLYLVLGECKLLAGREMDRDIAEAVEAISNAGHQAQLATNRLLEFVRGNKPDKEWVNFNRLVQETLELMRRAFVKEGIEVHQDLGRNMPWIHAHTGQIQQVVLNLLQNAREAVAGHRVHGSVNVRTRAGESSVLLEIEDNGSGVSPEIADRIFDPFFTTKSSAKGTGLGLSVCAGIAAEHGGDLRLEPRTLGTCLALEIPVRRQSRVLSN